MRTWILIATTVTFGTSLALAGDDAEVPGAAVSLRSGKIFVCERFAAARNYGHCFQEDDRLVTLNFAEISKVEFHDSAEPERQELSSTRIR